METKTTIRIYFESGAKVKGLSFWKSLWNNNFGMEVIKKAKAAGLEQAISFNVPSGYFDKKVIQYNISEIKGDRLPQCVEITDQKEKIEKFLLEEKVFLSTSKILIVQNEVVLMN